MALKSMTGFARNDGSIGRYSWFWEIRTVNGRGRDIRLRLPSGHDDLEPQCRSLVGEVIQRGNCNLTLKIERLTGSQVIKINENALKQVARAIRKAELFVEVDRPSMDGVLALRGVLETVEIEHSPKELAELNKALLASLSLTLEDLQKAREDEGKHLFRAISGHIDQIEEQVQLIINSKSRSIDSIRSKLKEQVQSILETDTGLVEERLYQEAVLLATKADLEEELVRLTAHIDSARSLLSSDKAVGRKLDFLAQEFNRETNTICSKSNAIDVTNAALELKALIDQMKEQVQNIE